MKRVGDSIEWNTKSGIATGVVMAVRATISYLVRIDRSDKNMVLNEEVAPSALRTGDPNAQFLQVVQQMREAQKRYLETKNSADLQESQRLEEKVDAIIKMCNTPSLFPNR